MSTKRPPRSPEQCKAFVDAANPHSWVFTADNLHQQAVALYQQRGRAHTIYREPGKDPIAWDSTNRATFLLGTFALENAIKAFLVYEHPHLVEGGYLHREICSHELVALSNLSSMIPYRDRDEWVLAAFENGNQSWMRYPCGRNADDLDPEGHMTEGLWRGYRRVAAGYGRKLKRLLAKGWKGPHGWEGYWETGFDWLD